jgi:hypothetical protein
MDLIQVHLPLPGGIYVVGKSAWTAITVSSFWTGRHEACKDSRSVFCEANILK